jgi:hypothetical protein
VLFRETIRTPRSKSWTSDEVNSLAYAVIDFHRLKRQPSRMPALGPRWPKKALGPAIHPKTLKLGARNRVQLIGLSRIAFGGGDVAKYPQAVAMFRSET